VKGNDRRKIIQLDFRTQYAEELSMSQCAFSRARLPGLVKFTWAIVPQIDLDLIVFDQGLQSLTEFYSCMAQAMEMQFFVTLTAEEITAVLNVSMPMVTGDWSLAKVRLVHESKRAANIGPWGSDGSATLGKD
jgi:hypothetical protein